MLLNPRNLLREECPVHTSHWIELTPICHLGAEQGSSSSYYLLLHNSHLSSHSFCGQELRRSIADSGSGSLLRLHPI